MTRSFFARFAETHHFRHAEGGDGFRKNGA
jgi:hypothetical protein